MSLTKRNLLTYWALFWLLCTMASPEARAAGVSHIVEQAYFEDIGAKLSFDEVRRQHFTPYQGVLNHGYRRAAYWIRLKIVPGVALDPGGGMVDGHMLTVRIRPAYLDEIRLYDPTFSGGFRVTGGMHGWEGNGYRSLNHGFLIPAGNAPRFIWLRLNTSSTNLMDVAVLGSEDAVSLDRKQELLLGLYIGLLVLILAWSIACCLSRPERVIAVFSVKQIIDILYALSYFGYSRIFLLDAISPYHLHMATKVLIVSTAAGAVWFYWHFLREFQPPRLGMRLLLLLVVLLPLELIWLANGRAMWALRLNMWVVLLGSLLIVALSLLARAWRSPAAAAPPALPRAMLVGFALILFGMLAASALPALGLIKAPEAALYGVVANGAMSGIIMMLVLRFRANRMEQHRELALRQLALSERLVIQERSQREEQSRFMSMLGHELRTSLSVLRLTFGFKSLSESQRMRASQTIQDMNGVIERCLLAEKLADEEVEIARLPLDLGTTLCRLQVQSPAAARVFLQVDELPLLQTDPQLVHAILSNLLDNASKYSQPGSDISIHARFDMTAGRPGVCVEVRNQPGTCGMPDPAKVFQKYYRSPGAHQQTGSGLGLYLMRHMARLLDGDILYQPEETHVRFMLWLPC